VLRDWITPLDVDAFARDHLGRHAWARPATAEAARAFDWPALARVLATAPDAIVCAAGERLPWPAPRDLDELRAYFRIGVGACLRHCERHDPELARIAEAFAAALPGARVQVQLFVTPAGTHGFGWHYDAEHVFIAQTAGEKDYYFRANTVERDAPFPPRDFGAIAREASPLQAATLVAGDFLYLPARWWHFARCRQDALSISVGVQLAGLASSGS
jgi:hypothetical protein